MPYIQFNDQQIALASADLTVGAFDGATVRLPGSDPAAHAVLRLSADGTGLIRRGADSAIVLVNGVQLGAEPSPLLHGDRVELGGASLRYGDDEKGGRTQYVSAADIPEGLRAKSVSAKKATTATGGRCVSLMDGRDYTVNPTGLSFGREVGCDIVVATVAVSRRHAEIAVMTDGYYLRDLSTNGVYVNGKRVEGSQLLNRGDVIQIGEEQFRFYADVAAEAAPAAVEHAPILVEPTALATAAPVELDFQVIALEDAMATAAAPQQPPKAVPAPVAPSAPARPSAPITEARTEPRPAAPPLGTLEIINEGAMKGAKYHIVSALTNIGRGAHNDIVIAEESLSGSHAKLLLRDGSWWLQDQNSTNGTYVGGRRVTGEQQLSGAPDVRFGSIKMIFRPAVSADATGGSGTRAIAAVNVDAARKERVAPKRGASGPVKAPNKKKGCAAMVAFLMACAAVGTMGIVFLFTTRG